MASHGDDNKRRRLFDIESRQYVRNINAVGLIKINNAAMIGSLLRRQAWSVWWRNNLKLPRQMLKLFLPSPLLVYVLLAIPV